MYNYLYLPLLNCVLLLYSVFLLHTASVMPKVKLIFNKYFQERKKGREIEGRRGEREACWLWNASSLWPETSSCRQPQSLSPIRFFRNPMDCSLSGSFVHGILQVRMLEWVAIPFSRGSSPPRGWICVSCIERWILYYWVIWEAHPEPYPKIESQEGARHLGGLLHPTWEVGWARPEPQHHRETWQLSSPPDFPRVWVVITLPKRKKEILWDKPCQDSLCSYWTQAP